MRAEGLECPIVLPVLKHRLTFGPLLIVLIAFLAWLDEWIDGLSAPASFPADTFPPGMIVLPILVLLSAMGAREVARIFRAKGVEIGTGVAILVGFLGLVVIGFTPEGATGTSGFAAGITSVVLAFIAGLLYSVRSKQVEGSIAVGSGVLFIHVYMGLMLGFLVLIRREHSVWVMIWILATIKSCDIGAFFTGTTIGKNKLIPWLSPGKTWEGLIGGMITSGLVAMGGVWLLHRSGIDAPSAGIAGVMGVIMGGLGQCGDLAASLLKRDAGVKDAGTSLPGFGGVLDIIDSPILVAPFAYWVLQVTQDLGVGSTLGG
jgi:phosphatidate cytidylyltransferase